jgi:EmrB/QacA subfamily drug resistance transporter
MDVEHSSVKDDPARGSGTTGTERLAVDEQHARSAINRRNAAILATCCLSLFVVSLDATVVNVALPSIRRELDASVAGLQWVIDGYTVVLASLLTLSGSTADRVGRRRTFQLGLALFTSASLLCSLAGSLNWLIAFRVLQAVGGSMLNPVAMSIITNTFTQPRARARAVGVWGGVVGVSLGLGPIVGGSLVESIGWRSIFWINVPIGLAAIALTAAVVPESRAQRPRRIDPVGQLLVAAAIGCLTYAIIDSPTAGWGSSRVLALVAVAALAVAGLVYHEPRRHQPLLELRFFRSVPFSAATFTAVAAFGAYAGLLFLSTLYLQTVRGLSPLTAGLYTLPMAAMTAVAAPLSGRIVGARGARMPLLVAGVGIGLAGGLLTQLTNHTSTWYLILAYLIFGLGFGAVNAPITNAAVSGMPRAQAGVAASIASTSRQIGTSLGVAVMGSMVVSATGAPSADFATASRACWWIMVGCGLVIGGLGWWATTGAARGRAARIAAGFDEEPTVAVVAS